METVRVFFAKEGRLKYISHLDVTRCLARVFHRCGLPIWYTQGFNPHAYLTFALPLPLGVESRCESFAFRLTEEVNYEEVRDRLNAVLPAADWRTFPNRRPKRRWSAFWRRST